MAIPDKKKKSLLKKSTDVKVAAVQDSGFKNFMVKEEKILTPSEFTDFIKDPKKKQLLKCTKNI
jgi:hypothetical protein